MDVLRTPDERFADLPDWPYAPRYTDELDGYDGLRVHYVDQGPRDAEHVFLCLHGEPSWSYLYRKMIPVFLASGARVVAPDLLGFGRSDKPVDDEIYTFAWHRDMLLALIEHLGLRRVTLVVQDWGGLLGLTLPVALPSLVARLIVMNTALPTGAQPEPGFLAWRAFAAANPDMPVGALVSHGKPDMSAAEIAAYDAPFPDQRYKAGVRRFPQLVPVAGEAADAGTIAIGEAARDWWRNFNGQSFMAIGMADPVIGPAAMAALHANIKGCSPPLEIAEAGHFVQEWGAPVAEAALRSFGGR